MVQAKKLTSQPPKKNAKKHLDCIVKEQRAASAATHKKHMMQTTGKGAGTASSIKPVKNSTALLTDEEWALENMSPVPTEAMQKSNCKIWPTEKMMEVLATSKLKVVVKAQKPKATRKHVLDKKESNRGNAGIEHLKCRDHGAKGNSALDEMPAPQPSGCEVDLEYIIRHLIAEPNDGDKDIVIPKGTGSVGYKGFSLCKSMELVHDADLYKKILQSICDLCHEAHIDFSVPYSKQSMTRLGKLFAAAAECEPYLSCFENDWATGQIVWQFINNRHKYKRHKAKNACAVADNNEVIGTGSEGYGYVDGWSRDEGNRAFDKHWAHVTGDIGGQNGEKYNIKMRGKDVSDNKESDETGDEMGP